MHKQADTTTTTTTTTHRFPAGLQVTAHGAPDTIGTVEYTDGDLVFVKWPGVTHACPELADLVAPLRHAFKARLETAGGWYGYGKGRTPEEAARRLVDFMPTAERRRKVAAFSICGLVTYEDRGTFAYPESAAVDEATAREAFKAAGLRM